MSATPFTTNIICALRNRVNIPHHALRTNAPSPSWRLRRTGILLALLGCLLAAKANADITYILDTHGNLWREYGSAANRSLVDGNVKKFQALDGYAVFVLGTNGNLWREYGDYTNRTFIDGNVQAFQPLDTMNVFVLGTNG